MNVKEMNMRKEERSALVQRWVIVTDEQGNEHLEARWIVEGEIGTSTTTHAA